MIKQDQNKSSSKDLSIVIPVCNEAQNLEILCKEIIFVIERLNLDYEIIFVEDGSKDDSFDILCKLKIKFRQVVIIKHKMRNGQSRALFTGIDFSTGKIVITMDADLQNDPEDIPLFIDKIKEGYDIVCSWRKMRKDPYLTMVLPSRIGNEILSTLSGAKFHDFSCTFKAFKNAAAKQIAKKLYTNFHVFIPLICKKMNLNIFEVEINHKPRIHGISKYCFFKYIEAFRVFFMLNYIYLNNNNKKRYFAFSTICLFLGFFLFIIKLFAVAIILLLVSSLSFYTIKQNNKLISLKMGLDWNIIDRIIN